MKQRFRIISVFLLIIFLLGACGNEANNTSSQDISKSEATNQENMEISETLQKNGEQPDKPNETESQADNHETVKDLVSAQETTAEIVYSGAIEGCSYEHDNFNIEIISYDLGYSGHLLTLGDEVACIKIHFKNKTNKTLSMMDLMISEFYLDGVETPAFGSDFYGNDVAFNNTYITELRPETETDLYLCIDCQVTIPHKVEVDIYPRDLENNTWDPESEPITLLFNIE